VVHYQHRLFRKLITDTALKNHEGLAGFISFLNLRYYCKTCLQSSPDIGKPVAGISMSHTATTTPDSVAAQVNNLDVKVSDIGQQLSDLKQVIATLAAKSTAAIDITNAPSASSSTSSTSSVALSYAAAAAKDIKQVVKDAVNETIKRQQSASREQATIAIYGLPEKDHDRTDFTAITTALGCNVKVISMMRIGRPVEISASSSTSRPRPLKVELATCLQRDSLLSVAKQLKADKSTSKIYISQWLSKDEQATLKTTRQHCRQLNDRTPRLADGKSAFIVVNGTVKERLPDGKLRRVRVHDDVKHGDKPDASPVINDNSTSAPAAGYLHRCSLSGT
jgi:hypothetical protein